MKEGWQKASLAEKIPEQLLRQNPKTLDELLTRHAKGLRAEWNFSLKRQWLTLEARGEDAEAFCNLLKKEFAETPVQLSQVERWDVLKGFITGAGRVGFGVYVDIGITEPVSKDALYPLHRLRAQLADGTTRPCRDIIDENALVDGFPLWVLVTDIEGEKISVELTDESRTLLLSWRKLPFDRVVAVGATKPQVEIAARRSGLQYDVIDVESLSPLVQCLVCKIGTDAPGVIAKIGGGLRSARLASYRTPLKLRAG